MSKSKRPIRERIKFEQPKGGEWVQPRMNGYLMSCCDCGLVHKLRFRVVDKDYINVLKDVVVQFKCERYGKEVRDGV